MEEERGAGGQWLGAAGAAVAAISLWQPWYSFRIPSELLQQAVQSASQFGVLGPYVARGAQYLETAAPFHVNAWRLMTGSPAIVLGASVLAGALAVMGLTGRARGVGRLFAWCGFVVALVSLYQLVRPPGPAGLLHPALGLWLALGGGVTMLLGGWTSRPRELVTSAGGWEIHPVPDLGSLPETFPPSQLVP